MQLRSVIDTRNLAKLNPERTKFTVRVLADTDAGNPCGFHIGPEQAP